MKVLLVDDHALFLEGLQDLLTSRGIDVVGTAQDGLQAAEMASALHPDIILMDIRMPQLDGLAALRKIRVSIPDVKVIMLTTSEEDDDLFEAVRNGASGYLLKSLRAEELLTMLREVERGEVALSPGLAGRILREFARQHGNTSRPAPMLTPREREVLTLVAQGLRYKEVANRLCLSERTVKFHMGQIVERLQVGNRTGAVEYARREGLV